MIILNDFIDKKIDKINNQYNYKKWNYSIIIFLLINFYITSFIYFYTNIKILISMFLSVILSFIYHQIPRTKKLFPLGNITLGLTAMYIYCWGGGINTEVAYYILIFFTIATIFKDWKDIKGDNQYNIITFPVILYRNNINYYYGFFILGNLLLLFYIYFLFTAKIDNNFLINVFIYFNILNIMFIRNIKEKNYMINLVFIAISLFILYIYKN